MFTKEEQKLAPKVVQAIEKITQSAGREWEWKPEVGEWCIDENNIMLIAEVDYITDDPEENWYQISNESCNWCIGSTDVIPLLRWEKLEEILEGLGFFLEVEKIGRKDCKCLILEGSGGPETECVAAGSGKTRQEAVMRAVIKLAKKMTK